MDKIDKAVHIIFYSFNYLTVMNILKNKKQLLKFHALNANK